ncbi:hypothetical protein GPECTOR_17g872 [Gonium pectorale]|uniref:Major facilitator superfamily (MFS) profile domain-containing protein n=1 Tax=Gonium pectorale TaxID=33097 RepID=A0A150GKC1_GONPE|nr:hypothetical protein GPECTOR_17g872 [Gonium pectorale]|eukprot:KXZ50234.1 hypothetical protein GPECTOR_17g872 [Gonium pectorale]
MVMADGYDDEVIVEEEEEEEAEDETEEEGGQGKLGTLPPPPVLPFAAVATASFVQTAGELRHLSTHGAGGGVAAARELSVYGRWRRSRAQQRSVLGAGWREAAQLYGIALLNYRSLLLALNYGLSCGAEMALYNILPYYLVRRYGMSYVGAGALAAAPGLLNVGSRLLGMRASELLCTVSGMRGRLWGLWAAQAGCGLSCVLLGQCGDGRGGLAATAVLLLLFGLSAQMAAGVTFSIVPYVSFRAFTAVLGLTSGSGLLLGAVLLASFFATEQLSYAQGVSWMGAALLLASLSLAGLRFPAWGGMLAGPAGAGGGGAGEEAYYLAEWTSEEFASGAAAPALVFALAAQAERGPRRQGPKEPAGRRSAAKV